MVTAYIRSNVQKSRYPQGGWGGTRRVFLQGAFPLISHYCTFVDGLALANQRCQKFRPQCSIPFPRVGRFVPAQWHSTAVGVCLWNNRSAFYIGISHCALPVVCATRDFVKTMRTHGESTSPGTAPTGYLRRVCRLNIILLG